jgi:hypothetical protein
LRKSSRTRSQLLRKQKLRPSFKEREFGTTTERATAGFAIGSALSKLARENQGRAVGMLAGVHLIVLTEEGELALVRAAPTSYQESPRFPAIEGRTWNHPAMSDGILPAHLQRRGNSRVRLAQVGRTPEPSAREDSSQMSPFQP